MVPATKLADVQHEDPLVAQLGRHITLGDAPRQASTIAVLPTPGSPISAGLFLVRRDRI